MLFMLSETERGALRDMLFHIEMAERFAHGLSFASLRDDLMARFDLGTAASHSEAVIARFRRATQ
jgi:hypothetical protein